HEPIAIVQGQRARLDWGSEPDGDPGRIDQRTALPHRVARALDGHGHHWRLGLQRHDKAALLERQQLAGPAAGSLGEDQKRVAVAQRLGRAIDRRQALLPIPALYRHEPREVERTHQDWQLAQLRLVKHAQPWKERPYGLEDQGRLDVARVIDRVDGGTVTLNVLRAQHVRLDS